MKEFKINEKDLVKLLDIRDNIHTFFIQLNEAIEGDCGIDFESPIEDLILDMIRVPRTRGTERFNHKIDDMEYSINYYSRDWADNILGNWYGKKLSSKARIKKLLKEFTKVNDAK